MEVSDHTVKLSSQQQWILKLSFKFRFTSAQLLAQVVGISRLKCLGFLNKFGMRKSNAARFMVAAQLCRPQPVKYTLYTYATIVVVP